MAASWPFAEVELTAYGGRESARRRSRCRDWRQGGPKTFLAENTDIFGRQGREDKRASAREERLDAHMTGKSDLGAYVARL